MKDLIRLAWDALFVREAPYAEMRDGENQVLRGLALVALIAVAVAVVGLIGTTLEWATTPKMEDIQRVVLNGLRRMQWYGQLEKEGGPKAIQEFQRWYDIGWQFFPMVFGAPDVGSAAMRIILLPLQLAIVWLVYGVLAHLFARLFGGQGTLAQTLGCTALATAPHMLNLFAIVPYLTVGGVVGTWMLICRYVAIKTGQRLTWQRAMFVTLLPYVVFALLLALLAGLGVAVSTLVGGMVS